MDVLKETRMCNNDAKLALNIEIKNRNKNLRYGVMREEASLMAVWMFKLQLTLLLSTVRRHEYF